MAAVVEVGFVAQCWTEIAEGVAVCLGQDGVSKGSCLYRSSTCQLPTAAGCALRLSVSRWQRKCKKLGRETLQVLSAWVAAFIARTDQDIREVRVERCFVYLFKDLKGTLAVTIKSEELKESFNYSNSF